MLSCPAGFERKSECSAFLRVAGTRNVTGEVNRWFNKTVPYLGKEYPWHYVMLLKARELAHYLIGKKTMSAFVTPMYTVERQDSDEIRQKILNVPYAEWKKMGFSKGTLHYMKQNTKNGKSFTLNKHVRERLAEWGVP
ncbi:CRISPR-associated protein Cas1 [Methanoculleus sp. CWC-02]|uniref:CRISPR-associated protein Cas1 n=1 Tax=Methanoculleus oceani TaxID=2184756 RepID=A0ABD4TGF5_9EURY|nr:CRISPR-associated protein Cas1 [Methanoculleus sp. CWC-02]